MRRRLAGLALATGLVLAAPSVAEAQTPGTIDVSACVPGATIPTDRPANGPSPVGRCDPETSQRAIDTAVWLWVLALGMLLGAIGIVVFVRSLRRAPIDAQ